MNANIGRIDYSKRFLKQLRNASLKIKTAFRNRLSIFIENQTHPILNNHPLKGEFKEYQSINVTGDWKALYSESISQKGEKVIVFEMLGTHSQLYK